MEYGSLNYQKFPTLFFFIANKILKWREAILSLHGTGLKILRILRDVLPELGWLSEKEIRIFLLMLVAKLASNEQIKEAYAEMKMHIEYSLKDKEELLFFSFRHTLSLG